MLVVVEDRDVELLDQALLHVEAVRSPDVLEIDAAEGRLEQLAGFDDLLGILGRELDVEDVDARKALEQDRLALHHRLARQGSDVAEPEDRGAVGDDRDQVRAPGVEERVVGSANDLPARLGDAGGVGQREIPLGERPLGGYHLELPGSAVAVVRQCLFPRDHDMLLVRRAQIRKNPPLGEGWVSDSTRWTLLGAPAALATRRHAIGRNA